MDVLRLPHTEMRETYQSALPSSGLATLNPTLLKRPHHHGSDYKSTETTWTRYLQYVLEHYEIKLVSNSEINHYLQPDINAHVS